MYHVLFISGGEIVIVALAFLLLFGSKKIPEMARGLGKGLREFRKAADDIKREIRESAPDVDTGISNIEKDLKKSTGDLLDGITDLKDDIQD
jgi:sec-independent protein translocase protein TatA